MISSLEKRSGRLISDRTGSPEKKIVLVVCVFFVEVHVLCSASKLPNQDQGYCHYYTFLRSLHFAIPRAYALYNCGGGALDLDLTNFTHGGGGRKKELRKRIPRGEPKSITFLPSFLPSFLDAIYAEELPIWNLGRLIDVMPPLLDALLVCQCQWREGQI